MSQRGMSELEDTPLTEWTIDELAFHHNTMSEMTGFLNAEGVSFHNTIIQEIVNRGGINAK